MSAHDPHDPWASLAESLGATPAREPESRPAPPPRPAAPKSKEPPRTRPAATSGNWDEVAAELGIAGSEPAPHSQPRPLPPPAREQAFTPPPRAPEGRGERRRDDLGRSGERRQNRSEDDRPVRRLADEDLESRGDAGGEPRLESGDAQDEPRRGRRRRGRRGGRGRGGRREGGEREASDAPRADRPRDDAGEGLDLRRDDRDERDVRADRDDRADRDRRRGEPRRTATSAGPEDAGAAGFGEGIEPIDSAADSDRRPSAERERRGEGDEEPRTRRRRRGRRGGRGRSRSGTESGEGRDQLRGDRADAVARGPAVDDDDEPLPTGYGVRPPARPTDAGRSERGPERREGTESRGESQGRRRRRRGRGDSESSTSSRESGQGRQRSRSGRRRGEDEGRKSSFSRGRRDDFAPVAGRHDEDDEGLEFLGVEEAGQESTRRGAPEDDDILVESGLNTVLDVPSWVEAIGIVIAGNLDARAKSRK